MQTYTDITDSKESFLLKIERHFFLHLNKKLYICIPKN